MVRDDSGISLDKKCPVKVLASDDVGYDNDEESAAKKRPIKKSVQQETNEVVYDHDGVFIVYESGKEIPIGPSNKDKSERMRHYRGQRKAIICGTTIWMESSSESKASLIYFHFQLFDFCLLHRMHILSHKRPPRVLKQSLRLVCVQQIELKSVNFRNWFEQRRVQN